MKPLTPTRYAASLGACLFLVLLVVILGPGIGQSESGIGFLEAWRAWLDPDQRPTDYNIAFSLRFPRTLLALQAGITLGLCGAVFQILFRNPLATPYTLGISSGGSLGALVAIRLGLQLELWGITSVALCAFVGAVSVIGLIFLFARGLRRLTTTELLLAGVTMGLFCSAMMMLVTYLSTERQTFDMVRWMMGSIVSISLQDSLMNLPLLAISWVVLIALARSLNQYMMGDEISATRGINVNGLQIACIVFASLATGAIVASCGPIGFVGLVVPQIVVLVLGRDCRLLLPCSALLGGAFLAICDWFAQLALGWMGNISGRTLSSATLPTGVVTAIVGVPIFLVLLRRRAK
ncbi:MAG: iron ABC transporter permease [Planctomycetes bacterium]|nr:iron ABC transporter permease [Planctomycetota bacterium]